MKKPRKTPTPPTLGERLRAAMDTVGWTRATLSEQIQIGHTTAIYWCDGRTAPPEDVVAWVERLAALHLDNPPPPIRRVAGRRPSAA